MTQQEIEALIGRSLTAREVTNLELYLDIAREQLEEILCISLESIDGSGEVEEEARVFKPRPGMSTIFTDIFSEVSSVTVNGVEVDYTPYFWDKRRSDFYNSVVLDSKTTKNVTITAIWAFNELPNDLARLWAQMFVLVSKKYSVGSSNVKSKQVEDFRITLGDMSDTDSFAYENVVTLSKYEMCDIDIVRHGRVCDNHGYLSCNLCSTRFYNG